MNQLSASENLGEIIVVDDDLNSLRILSEFLEKNGFRVRSARNGSTALMMAAALAPELFLLDIHMPDMDGFQVCQRLKNDPALCEIPVLFISAADEIHEKVKSFEVGGVDYINKPYQGSVVLARIKTHLTIYQLHAKLSQINSALKNEIDERKQIERKLVDHNTELNALHRISKTITSVRELPQALKIICEIISELFGAKLVVIAFQQCENRDLDAVIGYEHGKGAFSMYAPETQPDGYHQLLAFRELIEEQEVVHISDVADPLSLPGTVREYLQCAHLSAGLIVPVFSDCQASDMLLVLRDEDKPFDQVEITLAEMIAADIASAMINENLSVQTRQAAVDAERQRLARDLHDSVTQSIYSLTLLCKGWETMARQGTLEDAAESFRYLGEVGLQSLREMRLLLYQLRPSLLSESGLVEALQLRLNSVESRANIDAQLSVKGNLTGLPRKVEEELFNIAQEALNNSLKHAQAEKVRVMLEEDRANIRLIVEDNGTGFDTQKAYAGMGLATMQERTHLLGGDFSIRSEPNGGVKVVVSVRIDKGQQQP